MDQSWLTIEMTPSEYGKLIGHSERYVREYIMHGEESDKVIIRVRTTDVMEDIWDVRTRR